MHQLKKMDINEGTFYSTTTKQQQQQTNMHNTCTAWCAAAERTWL